jgi:hypothetical protein
MGSLVGRKVYLWHFVKVLHRLVDQTRIVVDQIHWKTRKNFHSFRNSVQEQWKRGWPQAMMTMQSFDGSVMNCFHCCCFLVPYMWWKMILYRKFPLVDKIYVCVYSVWGVCSLVSVFLNVSSAKYYISQITKQFARASFNFLENGI